MKLVSASSFQQASDSTVSERVLATIADQDGVDPFEFEQQLNDVIDPDALDALFRSPQTDGQVMFEYLGYEVTVRSDGGIKLNQVDG